MSIIKVSNVSFGYSRVEVLRNLSFEVPARSFLAVVGPNGAGKSTLLNLLCRTLTPKSGAITIDSSAIESYSTKALARKVAVVRQEFIPVFGFTVVEMVSMARTPYFDTFGFERKADKEIIAEALEMTDTTRFASRRLAELSGGERQRVFIARALAQDTAILLLDEPTSFLDLRHQVAIYDLLKKLQLEKGKTIVAVTHDINLAAQYCDETLLIGADYSYCIGRAEQVLSGEQIEKVFGVRTYVGRIDRENFFLPLGKFAKDADAIATNLTSNQRK
ncbi:MAG TPA: ABC transporter ATP-binding protein [Sedimentisphaerales bacterium]|nr:ABC transporter ATP-binding protein [Sedimentisphaerales bacterium]